MTVTTHIESAQSRVRAEREAVEGKREAIETFVERVATLSTDPAPARADTATRPQPTVVGPSGLPSPRRSVHTASTTRTAPNHSSRPSEPS